MDSSQDDSDSSGSQGSPDLPDVAREEVLGGALGQGVHGGDVIDELLGADHPGTAVLGSSHLLLDEDGRGLDQGLLHGLLGELVDSLLVVHAAPAEPVNSALKSVVPGLARVLVLGHFASANMSTM